MRLARARTSSGRTVAVTLDDTRGEPRAVELAEGPDALRDLIRHGTLPFSDASAGPSHAVDDVVLLAPLERPGKIVAIGLNYADHTAESGMQAPSSPLSFAKYPTSVLNPGEAIVVDVAVTTQPDWEGELAAVIGTRCGPDRRGTPGDVLGYTVANDVSARDLQAADGQWSRSKSLDTFCPLGPVLVTSDEFGDPSRHRVTTRVNGDVMQDAPTADMIFGVPALLAHLTATMTLEPGDVILTGTPPGVGGFRTPPIYLQDRDVVTVAVDGIGELTNTVRYTARASTERTQP